MARRLGHGERTPLATGPEDPQDRIIGQLLADENKVIRLYDIVEIQPLTIPMPGKLAVNSGATMSLQTVFHAVALPVPELTIPLTAITGWYVIDEETQHPKTKQFLTMYQQVLAHADATQHGSRQRTA